MKKLAIATLVLGAMSTSVFAAEGGTGKITFNGSIIVSPCSIAPGNEEQNIPLGQISNVTLENGGMSTPQPFSIKLDGCALNATYKGTNDEGEAIDIPYNNTVSIQFNGTPWMNGTTNTGLIRLTGEGQGAGVKLMTPAGTKINIGSTVTQNFVAGDNELRFQAALEGVKGTAVTPGQFDAVTNFVLTYN